MFFPRGDVRMCGRPSYIAVACFFLAATCACAAGPLI
jgi:hypothetical protein